MTISTTQNNQTFYGNGSTFTFDYSFIAGSASYIVLTYIDAEGNQTALTPSQYTLTVNAPATGQIWGVGGTVTYPLSGSPIANGTSLLIERIVPLEQNTELDNQGNFYPEAVEAALDLLEMQLQQVSGRTGQFRGTWAPDVIYNYGDIVVDGVNGANTTNWYMCANANTSGVWAADLAAGDWTLILNLQAIANPGTVAAGGDLTGNYPNPTLAKIQGTAITGTTGSGEVVLGTAPAISGGTINGSVIGGTAPAAGTFTTLKGNTPAQFDDSTDVATTAYVLGARGNIAGTTEPTNVTETLPASIAGQVLILGGSSNTLTLPAANSVPGGSAIWFYSQGGTTEFLPNGTDHIAVGGNNLTSLTVSGTDFGAFISNGTDFWLTFNGTPLLPDASGFAKSIGLSGYQKLPSGLIIQWGSATVTANPTTVSLPISFPNAAYAGFFSPVTSGTNSYGGVESVSTSTITLWAENAGSAGGYFFAIGN